MLGVTVLLSICLTSVQLALDTLARQGARLTLSSRAFDRPLIVGEQVHPLAVHVALVNGAAFPVAHDALADSYRKALLNCVVTQRDGDPLWAVGCPLRGPGWPARTVVTPSGGQDAVSVELGWMGYDRVTQRGWHTVEASLAFKGGVVTSNQIRFQVVDERDYEVLDTARFANAPPGERPPADRRVSTVQLIKLAGRYELIYQRRVPNYSLPWLTTRLATLDAPGRFTVGGRSDIDKPLLVVHADSPTSLVTLRVDPATGEVLSRHRQSTE